jgi:hypothetical protein
VNGAHYRLKSDAELAKTLREGMVSFLDDARFSGLYEILSDNALSPEEFIDALTNSCKLCISGYHPLCLSLAPPFMSCCTI